MPHPHVPPAAARRAAPLVLLSLLLAGTAFAGSPGAAPGAPRAPTAGLTFLVAEDFQLSGFDGALLSWRTRGEDGRGWRFGLRLSGSLRRYEARSDTPDTFRTLFDDQRAAGADIVALRTHERTRRRALGYYWAVGPTAGYAFSRSDRQDSYGRRQYNRTNAWRGGVAGVVGVEWRADDGLSLLAEYGGSLEYAWRRYSAKDSHLVSQSDKDSRVELVTREARIGLTVWFR